MNERKDSAGPAIPSGKPVPAYEAPAIEEIMTPGELEREVHYAGVPS